MRKVIGEENYKAKVASMLDAFPVFSTFDACVDIIDVDADDDGPRPSTAPGNFCTPSTARVLNDVTNNRDAVDDFSVEDFPFDCTKHAIPPVNFATLLAGESDFTEDEWAEYQKRIKDNERRLCEDNDADAAQNELN